MFSDRHLGSANQKNDDEMAKRGWAPLHPPTHETRLVWLTGAEKREQWGNRKDSYNRVPEGEIRRDLYHKRVGAPSRISYLDSLRPYDTTRGVPRSEYSFGATYRLPEVPADDVVERGSQLAAVNARLSPQGLIVANAIVWTELTTDLPRCEEAMGALLWPGVELPSESKLRRDGKKAIEDTEEELVRIFQVLAA